MTLRSMLVPDPQRRPCKLYLAGPYRAPTHWQVKANIDSAWAVARQCWLHGFPTLCPHANTAFMDGLDTDGLFLDGDLLWLEYADAVVMLQGWRSSEGAAAERQRALMHGKPVLYWWTDCPRDLDSPAAPMWAPWAEAELVFDERRDAIDRATGEGRR